MVNSQRIKIRMKELEITQKELADAIGLRQSTVNQKLNNRRPMTLEEAEHIASLLHIGGDWNGWFFQIQNSSRIESLKDMEKANALKEYFEWLLLFSGLPAGRDAEGVARLALFYGDSVDYAKVILNLAKGVLDLRGKELEQIVRDAAEHPASA